MLARLGIPARKYWETVLVFFFYESIDNDPIPDDYGLSTNYWMFLVEQL